jgi:hypothetical protein
MSCFGTLSRSNDVLNGAIKALSCFLRVPMRLMRLLAELRVLLIGELVVPVTGSVVHGLHFNSSRLFILATLHSRHSCLAHVILPYFRVKKPEIVACASQSRTASHENYRRDPLLATTSTYTIWQFLLLLLRSACSRCKTLYCPTNGSSESFQFYVRIIRPIYQQRGLALDR